MTSSDLGCGLAGDQPLNDYNDRDTQLIKTLTALIASIKELKTEMGAQREETVRIRQAIENCDACRPGKSVGCPCAIGLICNISRVRV